MKTKHLYTILMILGVAIYGVLMYLFYRSAYMDGYCNAMDEAIKIIHLNPILTP